MPPFGISPAMRGKRAEFRASIALLALFCFCLNSWAVEADEVLWIYNVNSTRDVNPANGIADALDAWRYYATVRTEFDSVSQVCSTYCMDVTAANVTAAFTNDKEMMHWDFMHHDFDVDSIMGDTSAVDTAGMSPRRSYLLQDMDEKIARYPAKHFKAVILGPGLPTQLRGNSHCGVTNIAGVVKSPDDAIMIFYEPGCGADGWFLSKGVPLLNARPWTNLYRGAGQTFVPGAKTMQRAYISGGCTTSGQPTKKLWLITCRLTDDWKVEIDRALHDSVFTYAAETGWTSPHAAVVDGDSNGTGGVELSVAWYNAYPPSYHRECDSLRKSLIGMFGIEQCWRDSANGDSAPHGFETQFGYLGDDAPADSVLYYVHAGSYNTPAFETDVLWNLSFTPAVGAAYVQGYSWGAVSLLDTVARTDEQMLAIEAIKNGFTYAIGAAYEPTSAANPIPHYFAQTMAYPDIGFAEAGLSCTDWFGETVRIGDPCGKWKITPPPEEPQPPPEPEPLPPGNRKALAMKSRWANLWK